MQWPQLSVTALSRLVADCRPAYFCFCYWSIIYLRSTITPTDVIYLLGWRISPSFRVVINLLINLKFLKLWLTGVNFMKTASPTSQRPPSLCLVLGKKNPANATLMLVSAAVLTCIARMTHSPAVCLCCRMWFLSPYCICTGAGLYCGAGLCTSAIREQLCQHGPLWRSCLVVLTFNNTDYLLWPRGAAIISPLRH